MKEIINAIVIDDNKKDIIDIATALSAKGVATLPVHYVTPSEAYKACSAAAEFKPRVIITDIQMQEGGGSVSITDIRNVTACLKRIAETINGPYIVLAWTSNPQSFSKLEKNVDEYFKNNGINSPLFFGCIDKSKCKNSENLYDANLILRKVERHLNKNKGIKAIMHWEKSVLSSATDSVNNIFEVGKEISDTLHALAMQSAGKKLSDNEAMAANESLFYILKDKVSLLAQDEESKEKWRDAIGNRQYLNISLEEEARLNSIMHFDERPIKNIICPGDIWIVHGKESFFSCFSIKKEINEQIKKFNSIFLAKAGKMVCMEISPRCDFSYDKKALKFFALGIIISENDLFSDRNAEKNEEKKYKLKNNESIMTIPIIYNDEQSILMISKKSVMSATGAKIKSLEKKSVMSATGAKVKILEKEMRMRESLLQSWIQEIASHNSRIGTVSFGIR